MLLLRTSIKPSARWLGSCMSSCSTTPLLCCVGVVCSSSFMVPGARGKDPRDCPSACFLFCCLVCLFALLLSTRLPPSAFPSGNIPGAFDNMLDPATTSKQKCHLTIIEILFLSLRLRTTLQIAVLSLYILIPRSLHRRQLIKRPRSRIHSLLPNRISQQIVLLSLCIPILRQRRYTPNSARTLLPNNVARHASALSFQGRSLPRLNLHRL